MGEIDTKPIESVQNAISFFGQGNHHRKNSPSRNQEVEKQRELETLEKELANLRVQLEAKDSAYKQALVKLDHHHQTSHELFTFLMNSDLEKTFYISQSIESFTRINELEKTVFETEDTLHYTESQLHENSTYIHILETQLKQANTLKNDIELHERKSMELKMSIETMKTELEKIKETENDAQVEIALLRVELHKGRSKLAASEAAEQRAQIEKSALYNALQNMGLEAEETKKENRMLKEAIRLSEEEKNKDENMKKELEIAMAKIGELRARAEQAITRAEVAEKIKAELEEKMKRRKEQKEKRKAALVALREETVSRDFRNSDIVKCDSASVKNYQPLGKVLNMKF